MAAGPDAFGGSGRREGERVEDILYGRRKRDQIFGKQLFADPAWDILLVLYAFHLRNRSATTMEICERAAAPHTTVIRWVHKLASEGLVIRTTDRTDKRRTLVRLSDDALAKAKELFTALRDNGLPV